MDDSVARGAVPLDGRIAWVFPGQGSQAVGMGLRAAELESGARQVLDEADEIMGFSLSALMENGPIDALQPTPVQQPAVLAASVASLVALRNRAMLPDADFVAGHSLGQYAAVVAAGAIGFSDALRLVRLRGELMEAHGAGAMAAIIGMSPEQVATVTADAGAEVANFNSPEQTTVSGDTPSVERAMELARERGAKRVIRLPVSGAFHSRLMAPAAAGMTVALQAAEFQDARVPIVTNVRGVPIQSAVEIRQELIDHICASVQWVGSVRWLRRAGVATCYEVGPGAVLAGLIARIDRDVSVFGSDTLLRRIVEEEGIVDDGR